MFKISSNGIITVNRGDAFDFPLTLNLGSSMIHEKYNMEPTDVLYLGIMEPNQQFETAIVRKMFTYEDLDEDNNIIINFWPEDTVCLIPGKYYYQVKLERQRVDPKTQKVRTDVETVVDKTLFYIQE